MSASSGYGTGGVVPGPSIETLTGDTGGPVGPTAGNINILGGTGISTIGNPGASSITINLEGSVAIQYDEDVGSAVSVLGILNIVGGTSTAGINMNTAGSGNTVEIILNDSLLFPNTNNTGTQGVLFWDGNRFVHNFGTSSTFVGSNAGTLSSSRSFNVGIGTNALNDITANNNTAVGYNALSAGNNETSNVAVGALSMLSATSCAQNTALGTASLQNITTGNTNIAIGIGSGSLYTGNESSNIVISSIGLVGESNVIRLGSDGVGVGNQDAMYIAGVYNRTFASPSGVVQIDSNFKLGSSSGLDGQLLIGDTGGSPVWANLTSTGGSVVITNGAGTINLEATGTGAGASSFPTDIGTATEALGVLNIFGATSTAGFNITTTGAGNTVGIRLNDVILLPNTNAGGTQGILFLGGNRFVHNFGAGNTFLGENSGNLTLTPGSAIDNVAVGQTVLPALTTGFSNAFVGSNSGTALTTGQLNSSYGFGALDNLTTGINNVAVGSFAGTNYTGSESNNILIGDFGTVADSATIRIGRAGVQTSAFMQGVFGASIGATNSAVFIDNTGKLGTIEGGQSLDNSSFMAIVDPQEILPSVASQTYALGTNLVETILWDDFGSAFFPGDGAGTEASFTVPISGRYEFKLNTRVSANAVTTCHLNIVVNGTDNLIFDAPNIFPSGNFSGSYNLNGLVDLTVGDVVTFTIFLISSTLNPIRLLGRTTGIPSGTWISGTLLRATP